MAVKSRGFLRVRRDAGGSQRLAVGLVALAAVLAAHVSAATASLFARGVTGPGGQVWMKTHLWVADHGLGFCRVDPNPAGAIDLNQAAGGSTGAGV